MIPFILFKSQLFSVSPNSSEKYFYFQNTIILPRKPKISYRYLKSGIEEFHRKYVLASR